MFKPQNSIRSNLAPRGIDTLSDEALINAIVDRAMWAIEELYQRYHESLYAFVFRIVANRQTAEDLLQEAFLAIWKIAPLYFAQSGSVRSWLFAIMHHRAIDYLRNVQRRGGGYNIVLDDVEQDSNAATPDTLDETWRTLQSVRVRQALLKLPQEQRMVIELAYFQGWTHVQISEGYQLPLGTVKARMRLGLRHLRRILAEMGVDEM